MDMDRIRRFLEHRGADGRSNLEKIQADQHVIRRVETTDRNKSYEDSDSIMTAGEFPPGIVMEDGRLIGFGIHIFNKDVYPLKSFEIYFRDLGLTGDLDLSGMEDLVFIDVYHNRISGIELSGLKSLRILGIQDNEIEQLDVRELPMCQGIDAGRNRLKAIDTSDNPELVELYVNDNELTYIDVSHNPKLKYFYCHNNRIKRLDAKGNPLLRHLNVTGNPMKEIRAYAPQREDLLPLELYAGDGGHVGMQPSKIL